MKTQEEKEGMIYLDVEESDHTREKRIGGISKIIFKGTPIKIGKRELELINIILKV